MGPLAASDDRHWERLGIEDIKWVGKLKTAGLSSKSPIGFGLLQGEWTHGPDLAVLISGMRNNNNTQ
ncbi:hypothetical protein TNCV_75141 [Trichonephila clavipes]|nr:hypothetical protein TNCV_75141 [Trichonephila clavipes]